MRIQSLTSIMIFATSFCCLPSACGDDSITLNEEYKGKTHKRSTAKTYGHQLLTLDNVTIDLKAGQRIEAYVKVTGDARGAALIVWNSDGTAIESTPVKDGNGTTEYKSLNKVAKKVTQSDIGIIRGPHMVLSPKTARLVIGEVPATGTYKITVYSDIAGDYEVLASESTKGSTKKRDISTIEKELKAAQRRVEELEEELKEARKKASQVAILRGICFQIQQ